MRMLHEHPATDGGETAVFDLEYRREVFLWAAAKVRETVTPSTWQAFWQTSVEARPIAGVAQSLGMAVGSVYIARSRVMAKLREETTRYCAARRRSSDERTTPSNVTTCGWSCCWPMMRRATIFACCGPCGDCAACQPRLTTLAAEPSWWSDAHTLLSGECEPRWEPDTSQTEVLVRFRRRVGRIDSRRVLSLLGTPGHPEMLGRLGRYDIERVIGSGGMGIVLKAHDSELNRPIAIKLLAPHLAHVGAARAVCPRRPGGGGRRARARGGDLQRRIGRPGAVSGDAVRAGPLAASARG